MRDNEHRKYSRKWLQYERQQPMFDDSIIDFYHTIFKNNPASEYGFLDSEFIDYFVYWLKSHTLNKFNGIDEFNIRHVMQGCTHYIDDLYQRYGMSIQTFKNDYKYHWRLNNNIEYVTLENLDPQKQLLIALPFPYYGDIHPQMNEILNVCEKNNISVHLDCAWIGCIRDITFDFNHPAIKTFGISLSKAGIGGNRIGVRFSREKPEGPITIMNDFRMNQQPLMYIGMKFMEFFGPEYFWKKYEHKYYTICKDFNLTPTKAIHIANENGRPVGVRSLLRAL